MWIWALGRETIILIRNSPNHVGHTMDGSNVVSLLSVLSIELLGAFCRLGHLNLGLIDKKAFKILWRKEEESIVSIGT